MENASLSDLLKQLNTSPSGLTTQEARRRLAAVGPNEPAPARHRSVLLQFLSFFASPLSVIFSSRAWSRRSWVNS